MKKTVSLIDHLPIEHELYFYQGCYYALTELLKITTDSHTSDLIKEELCKIKLRLNLYYKK